jgi:phospholipid transport system substrate-binding protein
MLLCSLVALADTEIVTDEPEATVATLHRGLVELALEEPNADLEWRYRALEPLIKATHDLPYIAEFALRRQWAGLGEPDRARYIAAFERLSIMTYASRFKNVTADTFKPASAPQVEADRARITAAIARQNDSDVTLDYQLQRRGDEWKIINIIADGVSDLALKRAEYQRILQTGTIDDLIRQIEAQTSALR